ncbi:Hypothetical protein CINCED_3A012885 [Cinara cedri]|uniref:DUF4371 domain-containing protein n=1 Tax=Cinara cedri TaxID=506608 RepID=A0A5E4MA67_9HEMI|nr:Hypothetical protein CINCED_3A012885 [Cinara cedri]
MENFLEFSIVHDMTGQDYDDAASMSGKFKGIPSNTSQAVPLVLYVHLASHSLHLAVGNSCKIVSIKNCIGTLSLVITFFRASSQRTKTLIECINEYAPQNPKINTNKNV